MKRPTDILRDEHRLILRALEALEEAAARLGAPGPLPAGWWDEMIAWLGAFADRTHHAREERVLFPAMMAAGAPAEGGPIAVMLEEHAAGRALIRAMGADAPASQAEAARRYAELLRRHIEKENDVLFPLADALLDDADQDGVGRAFADLDAEGDDTAAAEAKVAELARALAP